MNPQRSHSLAGTAALTCAFAVACSLVFSAPSAARLPAQDQDHDPQNDNQPVPAQPQSEGSDDETAQNAGTPDVRPDFATDPTAVETAKRVFTESVGAYRNAPAIRDATRVTSVSTYAGQSREQSFDVPMILSPGAARITMNTITFTAIDNTLYGETEGDAGRLYVRDYEGSITADLFTEILYIFPYPQLPMLYAEDPLQSIFIATLEPKISGYREMIHQATGETRHEIRIDSNGDGADIMLQIDPETKLVRRFYTALRDPNQDEADGTEIIVEMNPEILDELPIEEFAVETEGRRLVSGVQGLYAPPNASDLVKQPSPVFELPDLDGEFHHSDAIAGHALVIAFWQITHEGLLPVLPAFESITQWVDAEGKPVEVIAVNVGDPPDRLRTYWTSQEYNFQLLVDADVAVARDNFLIGIFPTVFVIAPDGVVHSVHVDFSVDSDIAAILKDDLIEALKQGL